MAVGFIPDDIVPIIHADLIQRYGGLPGIRDANLLASALTQARMTAGGRYVHRALFEKAAAYGYHLCMNHPFVDGNKRVAFVLMDLFLQRNGWEIIAEEKEAYRMMMRLASGILGKAELAVWLKEHSAQAPKS